MGLALGMQAERLPESAGLVAMIPSAGSLATTAMVLVLRLTE